MVIKQRTIIIIAAVAVIVASLMLFLFHLRGFNPFTINLDHVFSSPSSNHLLGTDQLGRDYLSRVVLGSAVTLIFALIIQAVAVVIGTLSGMVAGFFESGWFDKIVGEYMNIMFVIPSVLLILTITAVMGKSIAAISIALGLILWIKSSSIIRGRVVVIKNREYILAAKILGIGKTRILGKYVLAELKKDIGFIYVMGLLDAVLIETGLSFLGLGIQPPTPSLGGLLRDGMNYMAMDERFVLIPGFVLIVFTCCIAFIIHRKELLNDRF